jgi:hypothetical protein
MRAKMIVFFVSLVVLSSNQSFGGTPSISRSRQQLVRIMPPGFSANETITFTPNVSIRNAAVVVVPTLRPYLTVSPLFFAQLIAGTSYQLSIQISVPGGTALGVSSEGTIRLVVGSSTLATPLSVAVQVDTNAVRQSDPDKIVNDDGFR